MQIFGLPLWKISDEQYVERTRKGLHTMRRWRYIIALISLGTVIGFFVLVLMGVHLLGDLAGIGQTPKHRVPGPDPQTVYAIYYIAVAFGSLFGFAIGNALTHVVTLLFGYRKEKLLVEFWDALSDAEKARLRQTSS